MSLLIFGHVTHYLLEKHPTSLNEPVKTGEETLAYDACTVKYVSKIGSKLSDAWGLRVPND